MLPHDEIPPMDADGQRHTPLDDDDSATTKAALCALPYPLSHYPQYVQSHPSTLFRSGIHPPLLQNAIDTSRLSGKACQ